MDRHSAGINILFSANFIIKYLNAAVLYWKHSYRSAWKIKEWDMSEEYRSQLERAPNGQNLEQFEKQNT